MSDFLFWALAVAGSALVLTESAITKPIREWLDRLESRSALYAASGRMRKTKSATRIVIGDDRIKLGDLSLRQRAIAAIHRPIWLASKIVACPMCSGFWLGAFWYLALREWSPAWLTARAVLHDIAAIVAFGFAGSIASAIGVAVWLLLGEAYAALSLWRYINSPKDEGTE